MKLNECLKSLRKSKGWTQRDLADFLKIGRTTIVGYENGTINPPHDKLRMLEQLYVTDKGFLTDYQEQNPSTQLSLDKNLFGEPIVPPNDPMELMELKSQLLKILNSHTFMFGNTIIDDNTYIQPLINLVELYLTGVQIDLFTNKIGQKLDEDDIKKYKK